MSQQQPNSDPLTNSNQSPWGGGNALALPVHEPTFTLVPLSSFAPAPCSKKRWRLQRHQFAPFNRSRPLSTCGKNGDFFNGNSDATAFSVNVNNFWLIDFVLCSKTLTVLIRATLLMQAFYYFGFTLLYFTLPYFIFQVKVQRKNSNDIAMTHPVRHSDDLWMVWHIVT